MCIMLHTLSLSSPFLFLATLSSHMYIVFAISELLQSFGLVTLHHHRISHIYSGQDRQQVLYQLAYKLQGEEGM